MAFLIQWSARQHCTLRWGQMIWASIIGWEYVMIYSEWERELCFGRSVGWVRQTCIWWRTCPAYFLPFIASSRGLDKSDVDGRVDGGCASTYDVHNFFGLFDLL